MKVKLTHRRYGVHTQQGEAEVPGTFAEYAVPSPGNEDRDEWEIDDAKLLAALPEGFLPVPARHVLLGVEDDLGGTAHSGTAVFRRWAKYFDAYMLWLVRPGEDGTDGT
jgi:hypothetical protein